MIVMPSTTQPASQLPADKEASTALNRIAGDPFILELIILQHHYQLHHQHQINAHATPSPTTTTHTTPSSTTPKSIRP